MSRPRTRQRGFTLIEVLIVVVVVAILAVLIIPALTSGAGHKRDVQRKSDLTAIKSALEAYYGANNYYPSSQLTAGSISCTPSAPNCLGKVLLSGNTQYTELKAIPHDPKPGHNYLYTPSPSGCGSGACISYTLTATLENTKDPQATNGIFTVNSAN
jgi:type II secretion system protein G